MRIASSQVEMSSDHEFSQMGMKSKKAGSGTRSFTGALSRSYSLMQEYEKSSNYNKNGEFVGEKKVEDVEADNTSSTGNNSFSNNVINSLFEKLKNSGVFDVPGFSSYGEEAGMTSLSSYFGTNGPSKQIITYQESESMSFTAEGMAVTEDGRQIDFGISISMTRSFMQYMNVQMPAMGNALMDPLVINIGRDSARVSDQKFKFDLDADGIEDSISMPTRGSAFLALDLNGDGVINDGSELFGTKSGDGFGDLRAYDSDGNGWIDENDEIFDKLRVWYKDEHGRDVLADLKQADVGAIFLGEQEGEFSLGNGFNNSQGVIRSSGIFLKESGGVGTIQHVDLAVGEENEEPVVSEETALIEEDDTGVVQSTAGVLTLDLDSDNTPSVDKASRERANKKAELEAKRAERAEKRKLMNDRFEKHRQERKKLQQELMEKSIERREMYMEVMGL